MAQHLSCCAKLLSKIETVIKRSDFAPIFFNFRPASIFRGLSGLYCLPRLYLTILGGVKIKDKRLKGIDGKTKGGKGK